MSEHLPEGLTRFTCAAGWGAADVLPLPGDASFRRYFRLVRGDARAMLMHAPPPHEDPRPFIAVARWLEAQGLRPPRILAEAADEGFVLLEDFGDARMRDALDVQPELEAEAYETAIDALVKLGKASAGPFAPYDLDVYLREARLFVEWYCPAQGLAVDAQGWEAAWREVLASVLPRQSRGVTVLRDYHAENIMFIEGQVANQGLLDFQDALVGHPAYDLVSLLQDARRDVPVEVEREMLSLYLQKSGYVSDTFLADYAVLGAQRNAKIVGIFVRLARRDGKARYLDLVPRVWALLERDLTHSALAPVARWFDANIPAPLRAALGGSLQP